MKRISDIGGEFAEWLQNHGLWVVVGFLVGFVVTAATVQDDRWAQFFGVLTAVGTFVAALAALVSATETRKAQKWQLEREDEEKKPNLLLSEPQISVEEIPKYYYDLPESDELIGLSHGFLPNVRFFLDIRNMGRYPVELHEVSFDSPQIVGRGRYPTTYKRRLFVGVGEERKLGITQSDFVVSGHIFEVTTHGSVTLVFFYGATGPLLHSCTWAFQLSEPLLGDTAKQGSFTSEPTFYPPVTREICAAVRRWGGESPLPTTIAPSLAAAYVKAWSTPRAGVRARALWGRCAGARRLLRGRAAASVLVLRTLRR